MLHVYHYLTNIINQTVLPLYKKPEEMISFGFYLSFVIGIYLTIPNLDYVGSPYSSEPDP